MTAPGGTLVLGGSSSSSSGTMNGGTWAVSEATGRFARLTGSGTWTWTDAADDGFDVTRGLTGHLGRS